MRRSSTIVCCALLFTACGHQSQSTSQASPDQTKEKLKVLEAVVFSGNENLEVTLLELSNDQTLIHFKGVEGEFAGKIIAHTKTYTKHKNRSFVTPYNGGSITTLMIRERGDEQEANVYFPPMVARKPVFGDPLKTKRVDPAALIRLHQEQEKSGVLKALAQFSRERTQKAILSSFQYNVDNTTKACGTRPLLEVDWSSISDTQLKTHPISGPITEMLNALIHLCRQPSMRTFIKQHPTLKISSGKTETLRSGQRALHWRVGPKVANMKSKSTKRLRALPVGSKSLGQLIDIDKTAICRTPENKLLIVAHHGTKHNGLHYGDGTTFFEIKSSVNSSSAHFHDPRYRSTNRARLRYQFHSVIELDRKKGTCVLKCSKLPKQLKLLSRAEILPILERAVYRPAFHKREPYALARDRRGIYYYVDRGTTRTTRKDFHVYVGRRGRMRPQQMKDIVSDSKGEIFSTQKGELRLVVSQSQAIWITPRKKHELLWLPTEENLSMIYNELGPYLGKRLGTPCDDF